MHVFDLIQIHVGMACALYLSMTHKQMKTIQRNRMLVDSMGYLALIALTAVLVSAACLV